MRLAAVVLAACASCGCFTVKHCTYWNILPAFGIGYAPDVCPGGQPTQTVRPTLPLPGP